MNLLFDLDGTLTDPFLGITRCILYALDRLGRQLPVRDSLRWCIGPPLKDSFMKLLASDNAALAEEALALYRERYSSVGLFENQVYEGIPQVLDALQQNGHSLYVATSKPTVFADRIVAHFGLRPYFEQIFGSELNGTRNDKTQLISYILKKESLTASATVMIGDRKHDIIGARNNDLQSAGVLWGYGTKEELASSGAQACIAHPFDLILRFC